ncbi:unnamed protein product [Rhodiola kirilowii]
MMTSNLSAPISQVSVNLFKTQQIRQLLPPLSIQAQHRRCAIMTVRLTVAQLPEPNIPKMHLNEVKKRLFEVIPEPVKQVPWNKAESIFVNKLLVVGEKALKWIFIPLFALSAICDVIFSILKSKELLIPMGLFVGCTVSDFLNETFHELSHKSEESGQSRQLLYISAFFVVTRFVCSSLSLSSSVFFMNFANGGLMQALWLWRNSQIASRNNNVEGSVPSQGAS